MFWKPWPVTGHIATAYLHWSVSRCSLPQPWSARTYNFQSIPLTICNKEYGYFCSKQFIFEVLQCKLTQSYCITKSNEPQYQEHTFLQESSWVTDLETCVMSIQTSQLITLSRNNIDNRKSVFLFSESNGISLFTMLCCLSVKSAWIWTIQRKVILHFSIGSKAARDKINQIAHVQRARGSLSINKRGGYNLAMQNAHPFRSKNKRLF